MTLRRQIKAAERKATHRLSSMFVQEISFVDKAANGRNFLITKMDTSMSTPVKKETAAAATGAVAADAAAANAGDATGATTGGETAPVGSMQAQVKEELTNALADAAEKIVGIANSLDAVAVTDQPATPPAPADLTKQIAEIAASLMATATKYGAAAMTPAAATVTASAEGGQPAASASATPVETAAKAELAKAGRRMAKERMDRLGKAIDMLVGILKELRYDNEKRAKAAQAARVASTHKAAAPSYEAELVQLMGDTEVVLAELTKSDGENKSLRAKVVELEKRTRSSNVMVAESAAKPATNGRQIWAADMNDLIPKHP